MTRLLRCLPRLARGAVLLALGGWLAAQSASAQLTLTGLAPARNARNAPASANVGLTFNQPLDAATAANVRVFSSQRGGQLVRAGEATASGPVLTVDPATNFRPGETVQVTVPATVQSAGGTPATPTVYQFMTATSAATGSFGAATSFPTGATAQDVTVADLNNDGNLDVITSNSNPRTLSVLLGTGTGSFGTRIDYAVTSAPTSVTAADVNGDGNLDLLTTISSGLVSVLLGTGTGSFGAPTDYAVGVNPRRVRACDVNGDGLLDLVVAIFASDAISVLLNTGAGSFGAKTDFATSNGPRGLVVVDVNGDGQLDAVTAGGLSAADYSVSVLLGTGTGGFGTYTAFPVTGINPNDLAAADFNGDGAVDLCTANSSSNNINVLLGTGTGSFGAGTDYPIGKAQRCVATADVNGDSHIDLITGNPITSTVSVLLGMGTGSFSPGTDFSSAFSASGLATADVNDDDVIDIVTVSAAGGGTVNVLLGQPVAPVLTGLLPASGPIGSIVTLTGTSFTGATSLIFNGTPAATFSVTSPTTATATVPAGATSGPVTITTPVGTSNGVSFTVTVPMNVTALSPARNARTAPVSTAVAVTFDRPVAAPTAGNIRVFSAQYKGRRTATATASGATATLTPTGGAFRPGEVVSVSVPATVQSSGGSPATPHVYQFTTAVSGTSPGTFNGNADVPVGAVPSSVAVGDVDGDGDLDMVTANIGFNFSPGTASVRRNDGTGAFSGSTDVPTGFFPYSVALGDVDGDGDLDLLTANFGAGTASVRFNDGTGAFGGGSEVAVGSSPSSVAVGDVDADGDLDLLAANNGDNTVSVRFNDGTGAFGGGADVPVGNSPYSVAVGDVDGDGDLDLLAANYDAGTVSVRLNTGSGTFGGGADVPVGNTPLSVAVGDVDADGDLDLLTANSGSGSASVRLNNGSGIFGGGSNVPTGGSPASVAVGDVDGDGDLDLLVTNSNDGTASVRLNTGSGTFGGGADVPVGNNPQIVVLGDVDGDGDLDLLTANSNDATVSVRLNRGPAPTITSMSPDSGPVGTSVTITGTGFTGATGVRFNGLAATSFTFVSATSLGAIVPAGATTGPISVTTPSGTSNGVVFTVTVPVSDLLVTTAQNVSGTYATLTVTATGTATLTGPLTVSGAVLVETGGSLLTNCQPLTGVGTFTLQAGATLGICDAAGISSTGPTGAVRVTGTRAFAPDAVYLYDGSAPQVTGNGLPATVRELVASNPTTVTLSQAGSVTNVLRLSAGTFATGGRLFTLRSSATLTAYVVHNGGTASGNVTVQRYVGGPATSGYRHLSSPVTAAPVSDLTTAGFTTKVNPAYNNLPYVAPSAATFPNVLGYDEARGGTTPVYAGFSTGYFSPTALTDVLTPGRGWSLLMAGNKTPDFVGALTTGDVTQNLILTGTNTDPNTQKAGWHLLGNPYPQSIDWDLATVPAGMDASISVYRTSGGNNGAYLTRANGIGSLPNGILPLGQGFFARVTGPGPVDFTFTNALRVEANPATVARPAPDTRPRLSLTLTDDQGQRDETFVYLQAGATAQADDRFDGLKPGRNAGLPTLATLIGAAEAAVNGLPETALDQPTTVELLAVLPAAGTYALAVGEVAHFGAMPVELLDRLTGTRYDLSRRPTITLTAAQAEEERGRFAVVLNGSRTLNTSHPALTPSPLTVYPNPAATGATVRVTGGLAGASLTVFDATGRRVATATSDATGTAEISMRGLANGLYTVRSTDGGTARLVVE